MYFSMMSDEYDIIHTIGIRSFQSFIAALIAKKKKIPLIISDQGGLTTHPDLQNKGIWTKILYRMQLPMIRFIIKQSKKIITANEYEKKIFSELTNESKMEIIKNGINLENMKSSVSFKKKILTISKVYGLLLMKNPLLLYFRSISQALQMNCHQSFSY